MRCANVCRTAIFIKMEDTKYSELLTKLNRLVMQESRTDVPLFITPDMKVEQLTTNELFLAHVLLHRFYGQSNRNIGKSEIRDLHRKIKQHIPHEKFDRLDDDA